MKPSIVNSKLYVTEAEGYEHAAADKLIDDPTEEEGRQAIARNTLLDKNSKPLKQEKAKP